MLNQVCLVGQIKRVEVSKSNDYLLYLGVERNFKGDNNLIEEDIIKCRIWKGVYDFVSMYFEKDLKVSISGRISSNDGISYEIVAYDVNYLGKEG